MISLASLLTAAACTVTGGGVVPPVGAGATPRAPVASPVVDSAPYRKLFEGGATMAQFLAAAKARREQWERNYRDAVVPDAVRAQAAGAGSGWKLLVVAVDGCSDSVNTIPFVARLVEALTGVELRIVNSDAGRPVMDAHRTPDGRGATPTIILLDDDYDERGCWIERPRELRDWILDQKGKMKDSDLFERKMAWYDRDRGQSTIREVAAMLEEAAKGKRSC